MPNVYAAVFDNKIVKFGKSGDVHKRLTGLVTEFRRTGCELTDVMLGAGSSDWQVSEDLQDLQIRARERLVVVSDKVFKFSELGDIDGVFSSCGVPYIMCGVEFAPFRMIVDARSFCDVSKRSAPVKRLPPDYAKVLDAMRGHSGLRDSGVGARVSGLSRRRCDELLSAMAGDGLLNVTKPRGFESMASQWVYSVADGVGE